MKVLIMNPILYTAETDQIPKVESIRDTMTYTLCMGFVKNGDIPTLVAADCYRPVKPEEYPFAVKWFPCQIPKICKPRCIPMLKGLGKYLKKHGTEFDYIISSEVFSLVTLEGALYARKRLIIWHELGAHNRMCHKIPSRIWYNIVGRFIFHGIPVIPRSEKAAKFISRYCDHVLPVIIDHGIDLDKIPYAENKENYFVVVSQLIERKHIDLIIDRFAAFTRGDYKDYELKIIGDGVLKEALQIQAEQLGKEKNIQFLGKLDHNRLMPVLAGAKALLIYTSKDNSMVSIVESIAAGTPVITTSVPFNVPYILKNQLGIVKDQWEKEDLKEICGNNAFYVENCIRYRKKLDHVYLAGMFDNIGSSETE